MSDFDMRSLIRFVPFARVGRGHDGEQRKVPRLPGRAPRRQDARQMKTSLTRVTSAFGAPRPRRPACGGSLRAQPEWGLPEEGLPEEGLPEEGLPEEGLPEEGLPEEGLPEEGLPEEGLPEEGLPEGGDAAGGPYRSGQPDLDAAAPGRVVQFD